MDSRRSIGCRSLGQLVGRLRIAIMCACKVYICCLQTHFLAPLFLYSTKQHAHLVPYLKSRAMKALMYAKRQKKTCPLVCSHSRCKLALVAIPRVSCVSRMSLLRGFTTPMEKIINIGAVNTPKIESQCLLV